MAEASNYQAVLADLIARRVRLDHLIGGIRAEMGLPPDALPGPDPDSTTNGPPGVVDIHPDSFFGLSIIEAAKKYLRMARRAQHLTAIAAAIEQGGLKKPTDNVMSGTLVRAAKGREVTKVGKGMWGLSEWYPKAPKAAAPERQKEKGPNRRSRAASRRAPTVKKKEMPQKPAATTAPPPTVTASGFSDVALEVVQAAGGPIHTTEIIKLVTARGVTMARLPAEGLLNRQVKAGKLQKVGPSLFKMAS